MIRSLDTEITVEEIENAIHALKHGRSKGADGLNLEHLIHVIKDFNAIISICFKEGIVIPVYKGNGKDPFLTSSYCVFYLGQDPLNHCAQWNVYPRGSTELHPPNGKPFSLLL